MGNLTLFKSGTIVDDQVNPLNIHTPSEDVGGDQQLRLIALEHVVAVNTLLLLKAAVDADGVEHALSQQLSQLLCSVNFIDEDDDLVDGELVQQVA